MPLLDSNVYQQVNSSFYDEQLKSLNPFRRWFHNNRYKIINSFIRSFYIPGKKIVDFGAGSSAWNKDRLPTCGVDYNEKLLSYGKDRGRLESYKVADICNNGLDDGIFDIVIATEVLEHIKDVDTAVREAYRILKDDGVFIISVPYDDKITAWNLLFSLQVFYKGYIRSSEYYKNRCGHVQHFSLESLKNLLKRNGFMIDLGFTAWGCSIFLIAHKGNALAQSNYNDLTIVIPVKNESDNIREVVKEVLQAYPDSAVVIVDDASTDDTVDIIKDIQKINTNVRLLDRKSRVPKGLTISVLDAIDTVETKYFVVMDGDGQHETKYIERIYNQLRLGAKLCVASRAAVLWWRWNRKLISRFGNFLGKLVLFLRRKKASIDILSGFFGCRSEHWRSLAKGKRKSFSLKGYKILFDFLKLRQTNSDIENVYFTLNARLQGLSNINHTVYLEYLKSLLR